MALVALASPCPQIPRALIARRLGRCAWRWAGLGCRVRKRSIGAVGDTAKRRDRLGYQKVPALALIELTTLCDLLGLDLKKSKAGKRKATETCLFSVSLDTLLEADRRSLPSTQVPLVLQAGSYPQIGLI
ncbi:hypothetical protein J1605_015827 [Eschrichtius robustus]|uniref:Uncharacterized protein n=1 Tax=Eschrichtius robustus TaxID=9764 RepID=A0AB34G8Q8_ESCRO|nr:hypothetical protein J1605_015827 [Eschrichtius robustus]